MAPVKKTATKAVKKTATKAVKKTATKAVKKVLKKKAPVATVRVCNLLDSSGSMSGIEKKVLVAINGVNRSIVKESSAIPTRVSFFTFADNTVAVLEDQEASELKEIPASSYRVGGATALFLCVEKAIESLEKFGKDSDIYLVNVFTDGFNNVGDTRVPSIVAKMKELMDKGNWTFTFQLPVGNAQDFSKRYGIPLGNCSEWEQTERGTEEMEDKTTTGVTNFFGGASRGVLQTKSFYNVQTDLSSVKIKDLNKLNDVAGDYKAYKVDKESVIKDFVEDKTGRGYVIGATLYALTKDEKVQSHKHVVIAERNGVNGKKPRMWGGSEARELVGLPNNADAKVKVGDHSKYIIYVQSTSVNRKLVRGTDILVDLHKNTNSTPTWDHTGVSPVK